MRAETHIHQSEHEVEACSQQKAREKAREHVVFSFGFTSDWLRKCRFRLSWSLLLHSQIHYSRANPNAHGNSNESIKTRSNPTVVVGTKQVLNSLPEPVTLAHKDLVLTVFGPAHPLPTPVGGAPHGIWDVIGWNVVWDSDFLVQIICLFFLYLMYFQFNYLQKLPTGPWSYEKGNGHAVCEDRLLWWGKRLCKSLQ